MTAPVQPRLCACGCGGELKGRGLHWLHGHNPKTARTSTPAKRRYSDRASGSNRAWKEACDKLGRGYLETLPFGASLQKTPFGLVVCSNRGYGEHIRARARTLVACGHADWLRCGLCGEYAPQSALYTYARKGRFAKPAALHPACIAIRNMKARARRVVGSGEHMNNRTRKFAYRQARTA